MGVEGSVMGGGGGEFEGAMKGSVRNGRQCNEAVGY